VRRRLRECRLEHLVDRLDESRHWEQSLSPGEQQRLSFARALLQRPDWLFLDEASSALDAATEGELYGLLERDLLETTWVSIGHRAEIARFHQRRISLTADGRLASSLLAVAQA
jgi:putative ATP-binding cassette transporter